MTEKYIKSICANCDKELNKRKYPFFVEQKAKKMLLEAKTPKWAFAGPIILAFVFLIAIISGAFSTNKYKEYIESPIVGDIYVMEYEDQEAMFYKERYTLWKVIGMDEHNIYFNESILEVNVIKEIDDMLKMARVDDIWVVGNTMKTKVYLQEMIGITIEPPKVYKIIR